MFLFSASTENYNKWSPGKPTDNICETAETGKGNNFRSQIKQVSWDISN